MFWVVLLLVLGAVNFCSSAAVPNQGTCIRVDTPLNFSFKKFNMENGGTWYVRFAPDTPMFRKMKEMTMLITRSRKGRGLYRHVITYLTKDGKRGVWSDAVVKPVRGGIANATLTDGTAFKIYVLAYVPERYAIYYTCAEHGADKTVDYLYALVTGPLSQAEWDDIDRHDEHLQLKRFKGDQIRIDTKIPPRFVPPPPSPHRRTTRRPGRPNHRHPRQIN